MKDFKIELEKLLIANLYSRIDIYPLIKSHNNGGNSINSEIQRIISEFKTEGLVSIDDESVYNLSRIPPTAIELPDREIYMIANGKFEQKYKAENAKPIQPIQNITYGPNSPISGGDMNIGDFYQSNQPIINTTIGQNINQPSPVSKSSVWNFFVNNIFWTIVTTVVGGLLLWYVIHIITK